MGRSPARFGDLWAAVDSGHFISQVLCTEWLRYSRPRGRLTSCPWGPVATLVHSWLHLFLELVPRVAGTRHRIYPTCFSVHHLSRALRLRQGLGVVPAH